MSDSNSIVEYRPVEGFPGYRVGSDGTVWSCLQRRGTNAKQREERIRSANNWKQLRPKVTRPMGYRSVVLYRKSRKHEIRVHRLVLTAFCGLRTDGMQCRHLNGDPGDNSLANLRWGTASENCDDRRRHGTIPRGEKSRSAKLTYEDASEILNTMRATEKELSMRFRIDVATVRAISRGSLWAHLSE